MLGYPSAQRFVRYWQIVLIAAALAMMPRPVHAAACDDAMDWNRVMGLEKEAASLRSQVIRATLPVVKDEREAVASADPSAHAHALNEQLGLLGLASSTAGNKSQAGDGHQSGRGAAVHAFRRGQGRLAPNDQEAGAFGRRRSGQRTGCIP